MQGTQQQPSSYVKAYMLPEKHAGSLFNAVVTQWIKCIIWQTLVYLTSSSLPHPILCFRPLPSLFPLSSPFMYCHFAPVNHSCLFSLVLVPTFPSLHSSFRCAAGTGSTVAAPVAFTCLTAPSRLLSHFLFISLSVCPPPPILHQPSNSAVSFQICVISGLIFIFWPGFTQLCAFKIKIQLLRGLPIDFYTMKKISQLRVEESDYPVQFCP